MCRYAGPHGCEYKTHYACLACRYTAKHHWTSKDAGPHCPHCRARMDHLGMDFKAPRRRNSNQWRKVAMLIEAGIRFHSCGCHGPGARPRTLSDAKSQLGRRR
jgi:hypothetical protein